VCLKPAQGREIQILYLVSNKDPCRASRERAMTFVMKRLHKRTTVDPRNKPCDLYSVDYEGFPEEEHWIRKPSYKIPMCLIISFVNSWFCPDHEAILAAHLSAKVPNGTRQSGYKGKKCPKCQRKFFSPIRAASLCISFISSVALV